MSVKLFHMDVLDPKLIWNLWSLWIPALRLRTHLGPSGRPTHVDLYLDLK